MAKQEINTATELFHLSGRYQVAPSTTANQLHDDIHCWLEAAHGAIDIVIDGLQKEGGQMAANPKMIARVLYGALNHLDMVQGALVAAYALDQADMRGVMA